MLITSKVTNESLENSFPLILALNSGGDPIGWISYEDYAYYYSKNKILWSMGEYEVTLRGGVNASTGKQSMLVMDTIVAIDSNKNPFKYRKNAPSLSNSTLFARDMHMCAYCGGTFKRNELTRDHIIPSSKGGADTWLNVVTCCYACNQWKGDKTPEQAGMELLYVPYVPSYHEHLILQNRKILADQMQFLLKGVSKNSRLHLTKH